MGTIDDFCLLEISREDYQRRRLSFATGCMVTLAAFGLLLLACAPLPHRVEPLESRYALTMIPASAEHVLMLDVPPMLVMGAVRKIEPRKPVIAQVAPPAPVDAPKIETPKTEAQFSVPRVSEPPQQMATAIALPGPPPGPPPAAVHTGVFGEVARYLGGEKMPLQHVQVGGFGDLEGLPGHGQAGNPGKVPKLGAFDSPTMSGKRNGVSGAQGMPRIVANAGFGDGGVGISGAKGPPRTVANAGFGESGVAIGVAQGKPRTVAAAGFGDGGVVIDGAKGTPRTVAKGGFEDGGMIVEVTRKPAADPPAAVKTDVFSAPHESAQTQKPLRAEVPAVHFQPLEILSKPSPQYTEEARRLRVQGEVVLSVVFQANGALKVLSVVKSLGHGLDEMAQEAASQIRFKPAEEAGKPADVPATLHVEFRLT
jgi:TonB family protein